MLRLERIEMSGFKSFGDRTEARFPAGITAVVGPNGCGKSNISDAINWVLGEQSPKSLRGKQMLDVIFNGSERRKAKGMAEVSIQLADLDPEAPPDRKKLVVTRRLFRSGESEYAVNGKRARLKDIQEALRERNIGAKTYATIEQGRIGQILNAKPKERRAVFEDAAGISGFKHKKRLAELKLQATEANLLRVQDVVGEVTRQINSLKRQASKARRYQALRGELRELETIRYGARFRELERRLAELATAETEAREAEAEAAAELAALEAANAEERRSLDDAEREYRDAGESLHALDLKIDRTESERARDRERIEEADALVARASREGEALTARLAELETGREEAVRAAETADARVAAAEAEDTTLREALAKAHVDRDALRERLETARRELFRASNEVSELRNRRATLEEGIERAVAGRAKLEAELAEVRAELSRHTEESDGLGRETAAQGETLDRLQSTHADLDREIGVARDRLEDRRTAAATAREEERSAAAELRTLEDVATRFAGVSDGVRTLLGGSADEGVRTHGVVADFVEAGQEIETAAEAYLQALLPTVIVEDDTDACRAVDLLRRQGAGRTTVVSRCRPAGNVAVGARGNGVSAVPDDVLADSRVLGRLRDRLRLNARMNGVVEQRIGDAVLVETLEAALELHRERPTFDYVTRAGEVVYASGVIAAGGPPGKDDGLLAHNRRMAQARETIATHRADVERNREELAELERTVAGLEASLTESRAALEQAGQRKVELDLRAQRSREDLERFAQRGRVLDSELATSSEETDRLRAELTEVGAALAEAERVREECDRSVERDTEERARLDASAAEANEAATEGRARLAAVRQERATVARDRDAAEARCAEARERLEGIRGEGAAAAARREEAEARLSTHAEKLEVDLGERERASSAQRRREGELDERRRALSQNEGGVRGKRDRLEEIQERVRRAELERSRLDSDRAHLEERCRAELDRGCEEAAEAARESLEDESFSLEPVEERVAEIRGKIERIGPVNVMAIEEFGELEERLQFLTGQRDDLEQSMTSLKDTIRKINRSSRERFNEAFEAIRTNYREIFGLLFNGGRGDLRLEDEEGDVLESGIEILAQPPGKRLGSVQLMSGGEKAMSAIALLFAIFRYRPSPFCLLDEVDAPLDDVNVGRFTRLLSDFASHTQFILITHNKLSMEVAGALYGVTMEEPGISRLVSLEVH